jgi:hypothetical protein
MGYTNYTNWHIQMPLSPGAKLGPYEILGPIGAGSMGEVYKARDTRLERPVAIKVLPPHIAQREDLRARFEREARAVAALNHPHICTLYDVGPGYMVMELIEGETLAACIAKGAFPLDQALKLAAQIADALDRAHRAGVTHRDVKPQNVMLTRDGVKVLDFGLAKSAVSKPGPTESTLTQALTTEGTVMGTPQYMAPEQFEGKEADACSDIWAFGAVLYEMATGRKAFEGKSYSSLVGAILATDPAPMAVKPFTPAWLERLVRRCLAKDPEDRWQSMRDVVLELRTPPPEPLVAAARPKAFRWLWAGVAALPTLLLAALAFVHFRETPPVAQTLRYIIAPPENSTLHSIALSPDGRTLVIAATVAGKRQLYLRPMDALEARAMPSTEGASYPFWSPDSLSIGFFSEGKLKRISASSGPAQTVCDAPGGAGGSWSTEGFIVFSPNPGSRAPIQRVAASGGVPTDLTKARGFQWHPIILPGGRHFVYTMRGLMPEESGIYIASLDGKQDRRILPDRSSTAFAPPEPGERHGHLLFVREGAPMAMPFDAARAQPAGDAFPVPENVSLSIPSSSAYVPVTVSHTGTLIYAAGVGLVNKQIGWYDRSGKSLGPVGLSGTILTPALSPDQKSVAYTRFTGAVMICGCAISAVEQRLG